MLNFGLSLHIVGIPDAPQPGSSNEATWLQYQQSQREYQISQDSEVLLNSKTCWNKWVQIDKGNPNAYVRLQVKDKCPGCWESDDLP